VVEEGTDIHNIMEGNYLFMNGKTNKTNLSLWRECPKHIQNLFNHVFHPKGKFFYAKNPIEEYSLKFSIVANCFD